MEYNTVVPQNYINILKNGNLGKSLCEFIYQGNANRIVGTKVNTIDEFVNALNKIAEQNKHSLVKL